MGVGGWTRESNFSFGKKKYECQNDQGSANGGGESNFSSGEKINIKMIRDVPMGGGIKFQFW